MAIALARLRGRVGLHEMPVGQSGGSGRLSEALSNRILDVPIAGIVYGAPLNHKSVLDSLGMALQAPPYVAPPRAPVLTIKPRNTLAPNGAEIAVPENPGKVEIRAALGLVMGRPASRLKLERVMEAVLGYTIVMDLSLPLANFFRPSVRQQCRDGFCPVGPWIVAGSDLPNIGDLKVRVFVDDVLQAEYSPGDTICSAETLLCDVTQFMTLRAGDVLHLGAAANPPQAGIGQTIRVNIPGLGDLQSSLIAEHAKPEGRP